MWAGFGLIGVGLACTLHYGLDRAVDEERRVPLDGCEGLLRRLRAQGHDEEALRQFVAKFAGREWEAIAALPDPQRVLAQSGVAFDRGDSECTAGGVGNRIVHGEVSVYLSTTIYQL